MGSYFKPLRRKVGVVTLALACLLTAEWLRSRERTDVYRFRNGRDILVLASLPNGLVWSRIANAQTNSPPLGYMQFAADDIWPRDPFTDESPAYAIHRRSWIGFLILNAKSTETPPISDGFTMWYICFWWPVSLLTGLSAYLLLRKAKR